MPRAGSLPVHWTDFHDHPALAEWADPRRVVRACWICGQRHLAGEHRVGEFGIIRDFHGCDRYRDLIVSYSGPWPEFAFAPTGVIDKFSELSITRSAASRSRSMGRPNVVK